MPLPNQPYPEKKTPNICVFSRDPHTNIKKALTRAQVKNVTKIIPISKLKKKYASFEAKRMLASAFDMFLADSRVAPLLPKLVGKSFYSKNKAPISVDLSYIDADDVSEEKITKVKAEIRKVMCSTYMMLSNGPCVSIKIGHVGLGAKSLLENLEAVSSMLDSALPDGGNANIRSLHVKTSASAAVPIFLTTLKSE